MSFIDDIHQILKTSCSNYGISIENAVARNVSDSPDSLLYYSCVVRFQKLNKERNATLINNALALDSGSRGDIGKGPCCFKLKLRIFLLFDIFYHFRDETCIDNSLDGRTICNGKNLADSDHAVMLFDDVWIVNRSDKISEDVHGVTRPEESI